MELAAISDHIAEGLQILFVGYNPSIRSGETGHHYANPSNRFYRILLQAGLTPRLYKPQEDGDLLQIGYGFTNIVARPSLTAAEITAEEYREGRRILKEKIEHFRPKVVCFVGKGVYEQYSGRRGIVWGIQPNPMVDGVVDYVCPSSSGLVRMKLEEMVGIYSGIRPALGELV
ncbi:mismatch-specific DNA-glycosylase [Paenibacillus qinlingensis]|uniref:TDG/mug DNA glycosylase family protein n=1 Tax=Paenibacillus qinlingensis TaxID=1837343 RepID=A0ABU1P441_9BACL|nr:mismatch-specific DNA-glycosylase [Paenibacillus qinlingensis]MDR6554501.1 TDG/mug DNA glycosylase family protein [Paenibacillus qinlingensis]